MWKVVDSQSSFSPLKGNRLSEDKSVQSINPYLTNGRSVIGSDDNLLFPIWDFSHQCVVGMMEGENADDAVLRMQNLIREWNHQEQGLSLIHI